ncbi:TspO/MBR family protein [Candidatus Pelagibacter sp.]|uniref:TspO/MBR family protein n=1 Tax=Candidatus Pelagibacter sp. TaxID=2024849 RepID=UPI003F825F2A
MLKNKLLTFILFLIVTFSASFIGGIVSIYYKDPWYFLLIKPSFNPPDWIFAPVWTTLYLMMTFSIWIFWHSKRKEIQTVYIYFIHIVVNTTWTIVFFLLHNLVLAAVILALLIMMIVVMIYRFKSVNLISVYLMIPYLLWCLYALILNVSLINLN